MWSWFALVPFVALPSPPSVEVPDLGFEKYRLENGLTVLLHEDHRLPLVTVSVRYEVGSLHEPEHRSGFAHLFEHMMFQGSAHLPEDRFFSFLAGRGALEINASTGLDFTQYYETIPSHELEAALWAESDRMGFLPVAMSQKALDNQKQVVRNERRQRAEDQPFGLVDLLIFQHFYPTPHPYHHEVIGDPQDLERATLDDARSFFETYYTPANASLCLAGDIEPARAKALVKKYFGSLVGRPRPPPREVFHSFPSQEKKLVVHEPIARRARLTVVWPGPDLGRQGAAELDTLAAVLADPEQPLLGHHLYGYGVRPHDASAWFAENAGGSRFRLDLTVDPSVDLEELLFQVDRLFELLRRLPVDTDDILAAAMDRERDLIFALESMRVRAEILQGLEGEFHDPGRLRQYLARYRRVTPLGVQQAVRQFLGARRLVVLATPAGRQLGGRSK